jgi:pimeloyl-ACP methyl ester carboxylesterase
VVLLHGWPESAAAWEAVQAAAGQEARTIAIDLPGVGGSNGDPTDGSAVAIADVVAGLVAELGFEAPVLVGHDLGGMVAYAALRRVPGLRAVAILDTVVPGLAPWQQVLANPYVWHFAFHGIPGLPARLVQGHQEEYFDYFFDVLSPPGGGPSRELRRRHVAAYATDAALEAGFAWYRMLPADAELNAADTSPVDVPVLYLRGETEGGDLGTYAEGLRSAGVRDVRTVRIGGAGHFAPEDRPTEVWAALRTLLT